MIPPAHIVGHLPRGDARIEERADWIIAARAAGMQRKHIVAALGIGARTVQNIIVKRIGKVGRNNTAANAARFAQMRARRHGEVNGWTYDQLHAEGLTAYQAGLRRGESRVAAKTWAAEVGVTWPDGRKTEAARQFHREFLAKVDDRRRAGLAALVNDPQHARRAAMTDAQRADYDMMLRAGIPSPDALRAIGRPDLADRPPLTSRRAPQTTKAERERRRQIIRDPEAALLAMMQQDAARTRKTHSIHR